MNEFHINKKVFVLMFALLGIIILVYIGAGIERGERHWSLALWCALMLLYKAHKIETMTKEEWREEEEPKAKRNGKRMASFDELFETEVDEVNNYS